MCLKININLDDFFLCDWMKNGISFICSSSDVYALLSGERLLEERVSACGISQIPSTAVPTSCANDHRLLIPTLFIYADFQPFYIEFLPVISNYFISERY